MRTLRLIRGHLDGGRSDVHTDYQALPREQASSWPARRSSGFARAAATRRRGFPTCRPTAATFTAGSRMGSARNAAARRWPGSATARSSSCRGCARRRRNALRLLTEGGPGSCARVASVLGSEFHLDLELVRLAVQLSLAIVGVLHEPALAVILDKHDRAADLGGGEDRAHLRLPVGVVDEGAIGTGSHGGGFNAFTGAPAA